MCGGQKVVLGVKALQRAVPGIEVLVAQVLRIHQAPLPTAVVVAPPIAIPATHKIILLTCSTTP